MIEIGIIGSKNSGKTTLIENLIPLLTEQNLRVATIKHTSHQHSFDTRGKDSHRHREAGACLTMAVSDTELAVFGPSDKLLVDQLKIVMQSSCDMILVEGDKTSSRPVVILTRNADSALLEQKRNTVASYGPEPLNAGTRHFGLNQIDLLATYLIEQSRLDARGNSTMRENADDC